MKKTAAWILSILLLFSFQAAMAASFDEDLIEDAKQALTLMSYGEYDKALKRMDLKNSPSARELASFVEEELPDLFYIPVQTQVAVAYHLDGSWRVAVPIEEPSYDSVPALVFRAKDGQQFDAYRSYKWYQVLEQVEQADQVIWQEAYQQEEMFLLPDKR